MIETLQAKGERCVLDADGETLMEGIKARPFMIKPNEYELERLVGRPLKDEKEILQAARDLCAAGIGIVAVTLGGRGALVAASGEAYWLEAPPVDAKSKVGAGDSFIAGFLYDWAQAGTLETAARSGVAAGTAAVMKEGTHLFNLIDYEKLYPLTRCRTLS